MEYRRERTQLRFSIGLIIDLPTKEGQVIEVCERLVDNKCRAKIIEQTVCAAHDGHAR